MTTAIKASNYSVELRDKDGNLKNYLTPFISKINWEWNRFGGCGRASLTLNKGYRDILFDARDDIQIRVQNPNVLDTAGLTFMKEYKSSDLDADFSLGSKTATFTADRSSIQPATYIDSSGIIQKVITNNAPRITQGYYDATGFHSQVGLMIEQTMINQLTYTDGTLSSSGLWTGWVTTFSNITGTPTKTQVSATALTGIASSYSQRLQYTGVGGDTGKYLRIDSPNTPTGSVVQGKKVTFSVWIRSQTGFTGISNAQLSIIERNAAGGYLTEGDWTSLYAAIGTSWHRVSYTYTTTNASCSKVSVCVQINGVDNGDIVDFEIWGPQVEVAPYATSFIPTTTAALTRGAETLTYPVLNNLLSGACTIFLKVATERSTTAGTDHGWFDTDGDERAVELYTDNVLYFEPNYTDSSSLTPTDTGVSRTQNTSEIWAFVCQHTSPYGLIYYNGTAITAGQDTTNNFTDNTYGTNFYIGSYYTDDYQIDGVIQSIAIFNVALGATDIASITNILNGTGLGSKLVYRGFIANINPTLKVPQEITLDIRGYFDMLKKIVVNSAGDTIHYDDDHISVIVDNIADTFITPNTPITLGTIDDTGGSAFEVGDIDFLCSVEDALRTLSELAGDAEYGVDEDLVFYWRTESGTINRRFFVGNNISVLERKVNWDNMVNKLYLVGGDVAGVKYKKTGENTDSQGLYGLYEEIINNSSITTDGVANQYMSAILTERATPQFNIRAQIKNTDIRLEDTIPMGLMSFYDVIYDRDSLGDMLGDIIGEAGDGGSDIIIGETGDGGSDVTIGVSFTAQVNRVSYELSDTPGRFNIEIELGDAITETAAKIKRMELVLASLTQY